MEKLLYLKYGKLNKEVHFELSDQKILDYSFESHKEINEDILQAIVEEHFPIYSLIIHIGEIFIFEKVILDNLEMSLFNVFRIIKNFYIPLMRCRGSNIWIIADFPVESSLEFAFKEGLKALSTVTAMELSKKNITVNFLNSSRGLNHLIEWARKRKDIFITAQSIGE